MVPILEAMGQYEDAAEQAAHQHNYEKAWHLFARCDTESSKADQVRYALAAVWQLLPLSTLDKEMDVAVADQARSILSTLLEDQSHSSETVLEVHSFKAC